MGATNAAKNRTIRQEALREQLSKQKHVEHVIEIAGKLADETQEIDANMSARYKIVIDTKLKLINKYLPDLKSTELTGEGGGSILTDAILEFIPVSS
jgi:phage gp36-like protein